MALEILSSNWLFFWSSLVTRNSECKAIKRLKTHRAKHLREILIFKNFKRKIPKSFLEKHFIIFYSKRFLLSGNWSINVNCHLFCIQISRINICDALRDLVILHGCSSRILNCANGAKLHNVSHMNVSVNIFREPYDSIVNAFQIEYSDWLLWSKLNILLTTFTKY